MHKLTKGLSKKNNPQKESLKKISKKDTKKTESKLFLEMQQFQQQKNEAQISEEIQVRKRLRKQAQLNSDDQSMVVKKYPKGKKDDEDYEKQQSFQKEDQEDSQNHPEDSQVFQFEKYQYMNDQEIEQDQKRKKQEKNNKNGKSSKKALNNNTTMPQFFTKKKQEQQSKQGKKKPGQKKQKKAQIQMLLTQSFKNCQKRKYSDDFNMWIQQEKKQKKKNQNQNKDKQKNQSDIDSNSDDDAEMILRLQRQRRDYQLQHGEAGQQKNLGQKLKERQKEREIERQKERQKQKQKSSKKQQKLAKNDYGDLTEQQCYKMAIQLSLQEQQKQKYKQNQKQKQKKVHPHQSKRIIADTRKLYQQNNLSDKQALNIAVRLSLNTNTSQNFQTKMDIEEQQNKFEDLNKYAYNHDQPSKELSKGQHHQKKQKKKVVKTKTKNDDKPEKAGPLKDKHVAFTGQFQPFSKQQLQQLIEKLGGTLVNSITKKCNLLLQGAYILNQFKKRTNEDPNQTRKSKDARARKDVKIVKNDDLDVYFAQQTGKTVDQWLHPDQQQLPENNQQQKGNHQMTQLQKKRLQERRRQLMKEFQYENQQEIKQIRQSILPWTQKHKPKKLKDIIGHGKEIKKIQDWLKSFQNGQRGRSVLISGDPGLGKTTAARLIAAANGYQAIQYNASDMRNKATVMNIQSSGLSFNYKSGLGLQKNLIIMDEVDGMSGGDRGGTTGLINMIKKSQSPIICICNDRQHQKLKSLINYCQDIRFTRPNKNVITKRMIQILKFEGVSATQRAVEKIVEEFHNDIRKILTYLEVIVKTKQLKNLDINAVNNDKVQTKESTGMDNIFEASRKILNKSGFSIRQKLDLFFLDSFVMPGMIHQNYLNSMTVADRKNTKDPRIIRRVVEANEALSIGDLISRKIQKDQAYKLMPSQGLMSCVYPTQKVSVSIGNIGFASLLGKSSAERKNKRLLIQLKNAIASKATVTNDSVLFPYAQVLFKEIHDGLKQQRIDDVLDFMQCYGLNPTLFKQNLQRLYYNPKKQDLMADIPTAVKAKLTRQYNKRHQQTKLKIANAKGSNKQSGNNLRYDPMLQDVQINDMIQQQILDQDNNQQEVVLQLKKKKTTKKK